MEQLDLRWQETINNNDHDRAKQALEEVKAEIDSCNFLIGEKTRELIFLKRYTTNHQAYSDVWHERIEVLRQKERLIVSQLKLECITDKIIYQN